MHIESLIAKIREKIWEKTPDSEKISAVLSRELGVVIPEKSLSLRNKVLTCHISSVVKSEITLRKESLLKALQEVTPQGSILEIR